MKNPLSTSATDGGDDGILEALRDGWDRAEAIEPDYTELQTFTVRDGDGRERVEVYDFERHLPTPRRPRGTITVTDTDSFLATLTRLREQHYNDEDEKRSSAVFASITRNQVVGVLNFDSWRDHRVALSLPLAPEWEHWLSRNTHFMSQVPFADHLQDGRASIMNPPAADLLEIARTFRAHKNADFESGVHTQSGDVQFKYVEETQAKAGKSGTIEIPEHFELYLPVFQGQALFRLDAEFRYRAEPSGLGLGYRLDNPELVKRQAFEAVLADLTDKLGDDVLMAQGSCPEAPSPL